MEIGMNVNIFDQFDSGSFNGIQPYDNHIWKNVSPDDADLGIVISATRSFPRLREGIPRVLLMCESYGVMDLYNGENNKESLREVANMDNGVIDKVYTFDKDLVKEYPDRCKLISSPTPTWIPNDQRKIHEKTKNISMVSSKKNFCSGHCVRLNVIDSIQQNNFPVDLFGRDFDAPLPHKIDGVAPYRFHLVVENEMIAGWETEKISDCFMTGTVPLYWGDPSISETYDSRGIINLFDHFGSEDPYEWKLEDFQSLNQDLYASMEDAIENNLNIAKEHYESHLTTNIINMISRDYINGKH